MPFAVFSGVREKDDFKEGAFIFRGDALGALPEKRVALKDEAVLAICVPLHESAEKVERRYRLVALREDLSYARNQILREGDKALPEFVRCPRHVRHLFAFAATIRAAASLRRSGGCTLLHLSLDANAPGAT